jgi:hypothetical protein
VRLISGFRRGVRLALFAVILFVLPTVWLGLAAVHDVRRLYWSVFGGDEL